MKKETKRQIRRAGTVLFVVYVLLLIYFLFFSEAYGRTAVAAEEGFRYNLIPFLEIRRFWMYREQLGIKAVLANLLGNVVGFIPFGFILPVIVPELRNGFLILLAGFSLSLGVELIQLVSRVGCFDVDDLFLNTLGAAAGYVFFTLCDHVRRRYYGKKI
ncbi:MAG: VanZ family protein [Clostridiales bacterium]|nr:VanZ family protein [Clostridiales bacterium]